MGVFKADINDLEQILIVINETNRRYYRTIIPPDYFKEPVLTSNEMLKLFKKMDFYIYKKAGITIGVTAFEPKSDNSGEVHWVYVLPSHERKGIGTSLMKYIEVEAKKRKYKTLKLPTSEQAYWATNFYRKLGYKLTERVNAPEGNMLIFEKKLR